MTPQPVGSIRLNIVDGSRQPLPGGTELLIRVLDGRSRTVIERRGFHGPAVPLTGLPFHDNPLDWYRIIVSADGYQDAFIPSIPLHAGVMIDTYIMLVPSDGDFHFQPLASIAKNSGLYRLLTNGAGTDPERRYDDAKDDNNAGLGALLTIGTAIRDMPLSDLSSPLDYYWEPIWSQLAPDRFYAWVDARLVGRIKELAALHSVAEEKNADHFHPGIPGLIQAATKSWKQTRFDVADLQLTFHENDQRSIRRPDGTDLPCVVVEPDMDYFKDLVAHGLLEVLPNLVRHRKSDPRTAYSLRWTATRLEGVKPDFEPPVTIE